MSGVKPTVSQGINLTLLYCLPVLIVSALLLGNYYMRIGEVGVFIEKQREVVDGAYEVVVAQAKQKKVEDIHDYVSANLKQHEPLALQLSSPETAANTKAVLEYFIHYYIDHTNGGMSAGQRENVSQMTKSILFETWLANTLVIFVMVLTPYMLLGSRFGVSGELPLNYAQRMQVVNAGWWMKLIVGLILVYGWIYIINPMGRGASTVDQFLTAVNIGQTDTLPMFLKGTAITPIIAGFLGWYLYMLTYFFSKMASNDVVSSQVYGTMLQKFLFTWGVTIVFIAVQGESGGTGVVASNANIMAFLIGYFPMSAFSLIKDKGLNILQGANQIEKGQLSELPGISRWQILRLEEEGIDSLGSLAYRSHDSISLYLPAMARLVDYWTDIAQLYTIVGQENYAKVKLHCLTASEFVLRADEAEFVQAIAAEGITNPKEIARMLIRTFPSRQAV